MKAYYRKLNIFNIFKRNKSLFAKKENNECIFILFQDCNVKLHGNKRFLLFLKKVLSASASKSVVSGSRSRSLTEDFMTETKF